ncbi:hypothetical protein Droror1_Dr00016270 [Drosera rotundifolia]
MSFKSTNYYVDMPVERMEQGVAEDRLQLLCEVTVPHSLSSSSSVTLAAAATTIVADITSSASTPPLHPLSIGLDFLHLSGVGGDGGGFVGFVGVSDVGDTGSEIIGHMALREELASAERRAEEERLAHNATKKASMEKEVELEHRAIDASTALAKPRGERETSSALGGDGDGAPPHFSPEKVVPLRSSTGVFFAASDSGRSSAASAASAAVFDSSGGIQSYHQHHEFAPQASIEAKTLQPNHTTTNWNSATNHSETITSTASGCSTIPLDPSLNNQPTTPKSKQLTHVIAELSLDTAVSELTLATSSPLRLQFLSQISQATRLRQRRGRGVDVEVAKGEVHEDVMIVFDWASRSMKPTKLPMVLPVSIFDGIVSDWCWWPTVNEMQRHAGGIHGEEVLDLNWLIFFGIFGGFGDEGLAQNDEIMDQCVENGGADCKPKALYCVQWKTFLRMTTCYLCQLLRYLEKEATIPRATDNASKRGMIHPFKQLSMSFKSTNYYVDMPVERMEQGVAEDRLQLMCEVIGSFRPGALTALMGELRPSLLQKTSSGMTVQLLPLLAYSKVFIHGFVHVVLKLADHDILASRGSHPQLLLAALVSFSSSCHRHRCSSPSEATKALSDPEAATSGEENSDNGQLANLDSGWQPLRPIKAQQPLVGPMLAQQVDIEPEQRC